ncbi:TPA: DUF551 domain-containing protein [Citrobacter freundii]|uniref:DUF551 domain-containing protein n=1 Tax=Citrobacter freundii TaxID=546 RepID=UPI001BCF3168|nr:DUF551 domain-containing protein [Citrobacter freundii]EIN8656089.1 DUF551 domain-containing protein [Citrobacter freundii]HBZ9067310.1 DUF551 domain-containing protein [Citrobacter freundii]HBZ9264755.1 DUF551 domain-containing protein [Citrobacter freundii]HBZ9382982.1 DUF551 domain-containing protein [Citrobacter freundii]HBZ9643600.1 DUF551 domain-containing protein [Citrobacter freundii]
MTTIIREELEQIIFFAGEATCHPDPNYWLEFEKLAQPGVVLELARIALASLEAKPVAWTDEEELRDANVAGIGYLFGIEKNANKFADPRRQIMLYRHAQPVPVVPPAIEPDYEVIKAILPTSNPDEYACCIAADMWNACRSAMLAAAPQPAPDSEAQITLERLAVILHGSETDLNLLTVTAQSLMDRCKAGNSQVTPDRWIPVSERMPEKADEVLCAKEFDGPGDWRQKVGYYLAGKWTVYGASWTPTHWMPLPAAPQQEVKSALEHGMQRYAGAMQKLSEGDK